MQRMRSVVLVWRWSLATLACLVASSVLFAQAEASATKAGKYFTVTCEGGDARMAAQALAAVEPVWPLVCSFFGVADATPDAPLQVMLYRHLDGYLAADRRLTNGKYQPNQAMSHWDSKSAHVALQPMCDDAYLAEHGLPMQTQAMLAWEACHIARYALCPNFRVHPGWFHDGLAATTAQQVLRDRYPDSPPQPFFTQRWWRAKRLVAAHEMPDVSALLADQTDELAMRDRYAARIAFFEFARGQHPEKLSELAATIRRTGAGSQYAAKIAKEAARLLGPLGSEFVREVQARKPAWDEQVRSLWLVGDDWQQMAFAESSAVAFSSHPVRGGRFVARGTLVLHPGKARQMNFLFARSEQGFYSLAFHAGVGWTLFDFGREANEWRVLGQARVAACKAGVPVPFVVTGQEDQLEIELAGSRQTVALPRALPNELTWGIGAHAGTRGARTGTSGVWRNMTVADK